jgi:uncharacterized protein YgiM (DUF1202 family)
VKRTAEVHGVEVVDMSDEKGFGPRFHTLPFSKAIKDKLLTDYRVVIVGVDNDRIRQIKDWIEREQLVETDTGLLTDAKTLAVSIGVLKAIKDYNLHRIISFHGRIKRAREFSEDIEKVAKWLPKEDKPQGKLWSDYVSGEMPTDLRTQKLKRLKNIGKDEIGFLANARCLSEGVDVPALDAIVFVDPKGSEIDIIQSVGRAIRLSDNKTMGIIILPVFIDETGNAEEALESSEFQPIWDVLEALKSHDDRLCLLDQLRMEQGATRKRIGANDLTNIVFDMPTSVDENFAQLFRTHLVEKTTESWMFWFGLLQTYVNEHGHSQVLYHYKTEDGYRLGQWVSHQRQAKDVIAPDRRQRLEALPDWSWDVFSDKWEEGFFYLKEFSEREGHSRPSDVFRTNDGYRLGQWVMKQRKDKDKMSPDRRQRLEALPGWSWDVNSDRWEEGFTHLKEFAEREGHSRPSDVFRTNDGYRLGQWVMKQRKDKDKMSPDRRARLEELPGWSWGILSDRWEDNFTHLKEFTQSNGHSRVTYHHKTEDGYPLGRWVSTQRQTKDKMSPDRRQRLEALPGWSWDANSDRWEDNFTHLKEFAEREGHYQVPVTYKTDDGYCLGTWVTTQRANKDKMDPDRRARLEALPGWSWDAFSDANSDRREEGFTHLKEFAEREGHYRVPAKYKTEDGYSLGWWVMKQRKDKDKMEPDYRKRLEALPGWSWDVLSDKWEESFSHVKEFAEREGHYRVPAKYKTDDGFPLGTWVSKQRKDKDTMDVDRRQRLEALPGWSWNAMLDKWEDGFSHLKGFAEREGHYRVPAKYKTDDGYPLGQWVGVQRANKDKMDADRRQRLEALPGWSWGRSETQNGSRRKSVVMQRNKTTRVHNTASAVRRNCRGFPHRHH